MIYNLGLSTFAAIAGIAAVSSCAIAVKPPMFADKSLEQALEAAGEEGGERLVLVDATADWCPPCQLMDQTTWVDERLVEWVSKNAVAIQIDVDEQPQVARELGIRAMPTMIVYRNGEEFDRVVGYRDADQMLTWLQGVQEGERAEARFRQEAQERDEDLHPPSPAQRLHLAGELLRAGEHEEATEHFVELWRMYEQREPQIAGVRMPLQMQIRELVEQHEPARERFEAFREEAAAELREEPTWRRLTDWLALNLRVLDEPGPVIAWANRIRDDEQGVRTLQRYSAELRPVFDEADRLDLYGLIVLNPLREVSSLWQVTQLAESPEGVGIWAMMEPDFDVEEMEPEELEDPELQAQVRESAQERFRKETARLYTALLAANREQEAAAVADYAFEKLDDPEMRLVLIRHTLDHGYASPEHLRWLEEIRAEDPEAIGDARQLQDRLMEAIQQDLPPLPATPDEPPMRDEPLDPGPR